MTKTFYFFQNKTALKYLMIFLSLLLIGSVILFYSYKSKKPLKHVKKDNTKEIKRLTDIADVYFDAYKSDSAIYVFNKVKKLCNPNTNTIDYVYALSCIAELQIEQGNYIASEENATEALPYLKKIKNPRYSWIIYNLLGIVYSNNYDNYNAILYFKKAIALKTSAWRKFTALNNLVAIYMEQGRYKEAKKILLILASQKNVSKYDAINHNIYSFVIDNLGYCYYKLGNPKKALDCFYQALRIRLKPETQEGLVLTYKHLSIFFEKSNPNLSRVYADKAYKHALKVNNPKSKVIALSLLIKYSDENDLKQHSLAYIKLVDSITNARQSAKNQFTNIKYISKTDKDENLKLKAQKITYELQLERQKKRNIISYIIIAFILGFITFFYFHLKSKEKKETNEVIYQSEMRISKKLHDELANDVHETLQFVTHKDLELDTNKDQLLNNLEIMYSRTRNISKENSQIATDETYPFALREMISEFKTPNIHILLNGFDLISWNKIQKNKKIILYRVLQELFYNLKKHSNATLVSITFKIKDKNISVDYNDNGTRNENSSIIFKNGLANVENRIKTINGTITFDKNSKKGFKLSFSFPL